MRNSIPPDTTKASKCLSKATLPDVNLTNSNVPVSEKNYDSGVDDVVMVDVSVDDVVQMVINDTATSDTAMIDDVADVTGAEELATEVVMTALESGLEKQDQDKSDAGADGHFCNTALDQDQSIVPISQLPNFQNQPSAT